MCIFFLTKFSYKDRINDDLGKIYFNSVVDFQTQVLNLAFFHDIFKHPNKEIMDMKLVI